MTDEQHDWEPATTINADDQNQTTDTNESRGVPRTVPFPARFPRRLG